MSKKKIEIRIAGKLKTSYASSDQRTTYLIIDISQDEAQRLIDYLNCHMNK